MYEFSNFWWGFEVARLLTWPGYLPNTLQVLGLVNKEGKEETKETKERVNKAFKLELA